MFAFWSQIWRSRQYIGRMDNNAADQPTTVCAWCGKVTARRGAQISHGICEPCALVLLDEAGVLDGDPVSATQRPIPQAVLRQQNEAS